jgi:DNA-binding NtrC family response regulator
LAFKYPDLIRKLRPWEILALLAYNWPGNVREIERIGKIFNVRTSGIIKGEFLGSPLVLYWQDKDPGSFNVFKPSELYYALEEYGIDVNFLESLLNKHKVGLDSLNKRLPFKKFKELKSEKDEKLGITYVELNELFADAMEGLRLYCHFFQQAWWSSANLLNPAENELHKSELDEPPKKKRNYETLRESINKYFTHARKRKEEDVTITDMTFEELQKYYFTELLALTGGNMTRAAKRAGMPLSTFSDRIRKLGIS